MPLRPFNTSQQTFFAASDDANLPGPWQQGIATFYGGQPDGKVTCATSGCTLAGLARTAAQACLDSVLLLLPVTLLSMPSAACC